CQQYYYSPITF
nr:immunoglobulin light chain junction region [Macaca mulatta]